MKTLLLGLNEINFEYVRHYVENGQLPNFKRILDTKTTTRTISENSYDLWEPWIQWVTVQTGKKYDEHQIFRLGDIVDSQQLQIFEELDNLNFTVGAVSPFNAENKVPDALFFLPDPWTDTPITAPESLKPFYRTIRKLVNSNVDMKLSLGDAVSFLTGFLRTVPLVRWPHYFKKFVRVTRPGVKAVILDSILADVFIKLFKRSRPDFSILFLNSGAHIQHHYMFNSTAYTGDISNPEWYCPAHHDPLLAILNEYDSVIGRLLKVENVNLVLATGLTQVPHKELTFYWRPRKHESFMKLLGVTNLTNVSPRMSRDFLLNFESVETALVAQEHLVKWTCANHGERMFSIDNRGTSLFVELSYSNDIDDKFRITHQDGILEDVFIKEHIAFVAIKNGEHDGKGYLISEDLVKNRESVELSSLKNLLIDLVKRS